MFDKKGQIIVDKEEFDGDSDELMMTALDAGAEDLSLIHIYSDTLSFWLHGAFPFSWRNLYNCP